MKCLVCVLGALLVACDGGEGAEDSGAVTDAMVSVCESDSDCDDGLFCTGVERCLPEDPGAGPDGCLAEPACEDGATCDETSASCNTSDCETPDADGDGVDSIACGGSDCDDDDPTRFPGNLEVCDAEDHDEDCDFTTFGDTDLDADGAVSDVCCNVDDEGERMCGDDCDDGRPGVRRDLPEVCDTLDNDCDGFVDENVTSVYYLDEDGDMYGVPGTTMEGCSVPAGYATVSTDCDDGAAERNPGNAEACDEVDNDCDEIVDENVVTTIYRDEDGDGFGNPAMSIPGCAAGGGWVINNTDCDDAEPASHPGLSETCDGLDNDCDGPIDETVQSTFYRDADGDDYGLVTMPIQACTTPDGYASMPGDCADDDATRNPGETEVCDGADNNCQNGVDEFVTNTYYRDADMDLRGSSLQIVSACSQPPGYVTNTDDCDDLRADVYTGAPELCDSRDNDCDTEVDEDGMPTWYLDDDGDGFGTTAGTTVACTRPAGYAGNSDDCDDINPDVNPSETEICNGVDDDCDMVTDNATTVPYYRDADGDGFGIASSSILNGCTAPAGYAAATGDCDDTRMEVIPSFRECTSTSVYRTCQPTGLWSDSNCSGGTPHCDYENASCTSDACGDGVTHPDEQCDDGNSVEADRCDNSCRIVPGPTRPITPYSNRADGTLRPVFRYAPSADAAEYDIQLSSTRNFSSVAYQFETSGVTYTPNTDIARGRYWWRVRGKTSAAMGAVPGPWSVAFNTRVGYGLHAFVGAGVTDNIVWAVPGNTPRVHVLSFGDLGHGSAAGITSGDINGDGLADLVIADPDWDDSFYTPIPDTGRVAIYLGNTGGQFSSPAFRRFLSGNLAANVRFGEMTGMVGDVDGDGTDNLVTGLAADNPHLYFGYPPTNEIELSVPNYDPRYSRVSGGDLNGDGLSDIVITSYRDGSTGLSSGSIHVFFGRTLWGAGPVAPSLTFSGLAGSYAGCSVTLDDLDRDGYADLFVGGLGVNSATPSTLGSGRVLGWRGGASFDTGVDLTYGPVSAGFGWSLDSGVDLDSDGYLDLAVGAPTTNNSRGTHQEFYGSSPLAVNAGPVVPGSQNGAHHGRSLGMYETNAGPSVVVGAPFFDPTAGRQNAGRISVWRAAANQGSNAGAVANDNLGMTIGR